MRRQKKLSRGTRIGYALLAGALVLLAVLICCAHYLASGRPRAADNGEVAAALEEAAQARADRASALAAARKKAPPDAPVKPDWDFKALLESCDGPRQRAMVALVSCYVTNPDDIPDYAVDYIESMMRERSWFRDPPPSPFDMAIDLDTCTEEEVLAGVCPFLLNLQPLREVEAGLELGLCDGIVDAIGNPRWSNVVALSYLFAGRAACEAQAGEPGKAVETCLVGYRVAHLLGLWPHYHSFVERYNADRMIDRALCRVVDAAPVAQEDRARILDALDARKATDGLARALRLHAAYLEIGRDAETQGYPEATRLGFAFTGRGAMERAKTIIQLLDKPPCAVPQQIAAIGKDVVAGYWVNLICENGILSYKLHAREAFMGDIVRIVFALEDYARDHGSYPASLEALVPFPLPEIPKDPLSGTPVDYTSTGQSFTLSAPAVGDIPNEFYWTAQK